MSELGPWPALGAVAILLLLRQPLLVILLVLAALAQLQWGQAKLQFIADDIWTALDRELLLAIPMYVLCGQIVSRGDTAARLVAIAQALTPRIPGGLAVAGVLACAFDASLSGSSAVTMLAVGSVTVPAMLRNGYERRYALGAVMAGGSLGVMIPPSIPMIVYALVTGVPVLDLYRAGLLAGLLLTLAFVLHAVWFHRKRPTQAFDAAVLRGTVRRGIWALLLLPVLLGGLYGGAFGLTESAAVAALYVALIELFVHRALTPRELGAALLETARIGGALFPIVALALSLSLLLNEHQIPQQLTQWVQEQVHSPVGFMLGANLLLLAAGCVLTMEAAIVILAPLLAPLAVAYGHDPVLFGIVMILNLEIGFLTPPVGMNLIVATGGLNQPFGFLCRAALPFVALMLACLALIAWQPWLVIGWR